MARPTDSQDRKRMEKYDKKNRNQINKDMEKLRDKNDVDKYKGKGGVSGDERDHYSSEEINEEFVASELLDIAKLLSDQIGD